MSYFEGLAGAARQAFGASQQGADPIETSAEEAVFMPGIFVPMSYKRVLDAEFALFCDSMVIEPGIARNQALRENLFVVIVSLVNLIPVFVVGRPGTSKSLTMRLIANNMRGAQSESPFWKRFPAVHVVPYQCSPHSTSDSILFQYHKACQYASSRSKDTITVLLLDEVGLAELSPDLPLKVLHEILVDPPIAIVGISNWVLDPAKMNRACLLRRPDPDANELAATASAIAGGLEDPVWLNSISAAFHSVYTNQIGRDWIGMRDFYALIKSLRKRPKSGGSAAGEAATSATQLQQQQRQLEGQLPSAGVGGRAAAAAGEAALSAVEDNGGRMVWSQFVTLLCRNFGGKPAVLKEVLRVFHAECESRTLVPRRVRQLQRQMPSLLSLIRANLTDPDARHLMILTVHSAALTLLFQCGVVSHATTKVLIGSSFPEDQDEYHLISQINAVKRAMQLGQTVVLYNCDNLYEALYDVLNQAFVRRETGGPEGSVQKFLRLAIGKRSQLCPVHDRFRIIAVAEQEHAYRNLDLPLLNRLEKQLLKHTDLCTERNKGGELDALSAWMQIVLDECGGGSLGDYFPGFQEETTLSSLVLAVQQDLSHGDAIEQCKHALVCCATPLAVLKSATLRKVKPTHFEDKATGEVIHTTLYPGLGIYLRDRFDKLNTSTSLEEMAAVGGWPATFSLVATRSASTHLDMALLQTGHGETEALRGLSQRMTKIALADIGSEVELTNQTKRFFEVESVEPALLVVQVDPLLTAASIVDHARYICASEAERSRQRTVIDCSPLFREVLLGPEIAQVPAYAAALSAGKVPSFQRHVVFVLNIPLGVAGRLRQFQLTFESVWERCFIDDLRCEDATLPTARLLRTNVHELARSVQGLLLPDFIRRNFTSALALVVHPQLQVTQEFESTLFPERIRVFKSLLDDPAFLDFLVNDADAILEEYCVDAVRGGLQGHVIIAMQRCNSIGSLRQALLSSLEQVITAAFAVAIGRLDRNFNLRLLLDDAQTADVWRTLCFIRKFSLTHLSAPESTDFTVAVENDGHHAGAFCCRFPFSYYIINFLEGLKDEGDIDFTSETVSLTEQLASRMEAAPSIGATAAKSIVEHFAAGTGGGGGGGGGNGGADAYLFDYINQCSPNFSSISVDVQITVYKAVLRQTGGFASPAALHAAVWQQEQRLFLVCSLLDNLRALHPALFQLMHSLIDAAGSTSTSTSTSSPSTSYGGAAEVDSEAPAAPTLTAVAAISRTAAVSSASQMERMLLEALIEQLNDEAARGNFGAGPPETRPVVTESHMVAWCALVAQVRPHAEQLIAAAFDPEEPAAILLNAGLARVEIAKLAVEEVMLPAYAKVAVQQRGFRSYFGAGGKPADPMHQVIQTMGPVLRIVQEQDPFEVDSIFLLLSKLSDAMSKLLKEDLRAPRAAFIRRFTLRFFRELLCTQNVVVWKPQLVEALAEVALGISERLPSDVGNQGLQKTLMQSVLAVPDARTHFERCLSELAARSPIESLVLYLEHFENQLHWVGFQTKQEECAVCFELTNPSNFTTAVCGHSVCSECAPDVSSCPICRHEQPRWAGGGYYAQLPTLVGTGDLENLDAVGLRVIERLRGIALARFVCWNEAQTLIGIVDNTLSTSTSNGNGGGSSVVHISSSSESGQEGSTALQHVPSKVLVDSDCGSMRTAFLRMIAKEGGLALLDAIVAVRRQWLPWLVAEVGIAETTVEIGFDPFTAQQPGTDRFAQAEYVSCCNTLSGCISDGKFPDASLQDLQYISKTQLIRVLFTAGYSELVNRPPTAAGAAAVDGGSQPIDSLVSSINRHFDRMPTLAFAVGLCTRFEGILPQPSAMAKLFTVDHAAPVAAQAASLLKLQVITHVVTVAQSRDRSWFGALLRSPRKQHESMMPTMPDDELAMVMRASERGSAEQYDGLNKSAGGINGSVWYTCEAGHPYSVGDCGRNIVTAKCPCGANIGGREHNTLTSNTKIDAAEHLALGAGQGYMESCVQGDGSDQLTRPITAVTVRILRLIMHSILAVGTLDFFSGAGRKAADVTQLVFGADTHRAPQDAAEFLSAQFHADWEALRRHLSLSNEDVALVLHMVLRKCAVGKLPAGTFTTEGERQEAEVVFEKNCVTPIVSALSASIAEARDQFQTAETAREKRMVGVLGKTRWDDIKYTKLPGTAAEFLWQHKEPLTLASFRRAVDLCSSPSGGGDSGGAAAVAGSEVAVLREFLTVEGELPAIKHLPAILAWHKIIFEAFRTGLPRDQAQKLSNSDVIKRLPQNQQRRAADVLERFCVGFNEVFPKIQFLFGCQENHFKDLVMSPQTPVVFSIPNQTKGEEGLEGSCTIAVLDRLQTLQNTMLLAYRTAAATAPGATEGNNGGGSGGGGGAAAAAHAYPTTPTSPRGPGGGGGCRMQPRRQLSTTSQTKKLLRKSWSSTTGPLNSSQSLLPTRPILDVAGSLTWRVLPTK